MERKYKMGEDEKVLLAQYGIKTESKIVYLYNEHRYEFAKDAINYARLEAERDKETTPTSDK
ncbi:hypothetical protein [Kaarinaea lacus]